MRRAAARQTSPKVQALGTRVVLKIKIPFGRPCIKVPYYIRNKKDPNLANYPYVLRSQLRGGKKAGGCFRIEPHRIYGCSAVSFFKSHLDLVEAFLSMHVRQA